ncbi:unnamed protein product [marine sediment metagenome]|uniref:Uncharacterized protein n=1 Tax=marine sediment metagenome TaxID=412755 RepID=X1VEX9_9ZZZZ
MEKLYVMEISAQNLKYSTDMLRFDGCYQVESSKDGTLFRLYCVGYTPARWASFNAKPTLVRTDRVSAKERSEKCVAASGFVQGLRFAQHSHGDRLVEGNIFSTNL